MSKEISLFSHNENAYEKLNEMLKTTNYCTINHATGTGKSFIILKYLYENRNKRILYLSPSYAINDQLINEHFKELDLSLSDFNKFDTMIYSNLLKQNMGNLASNYDVIILDEYQRCGAYEWGKKIKELMSIIKSTNKICIGTSATPIRYLDHNRNMCKILFDEHIASELSVADAMIQGILPVPYYINYSLDLIKQITKLRKRIEKNIPYTELKNKYLSEIDNLENSLNHIGIDNEHISDKILPNGKYLVFSSTIDKMDTDIMSIKNALNIDTLLYYKISSDFSPKTNNQIIRNFRNLKNNVPTFLSSINIANEGIHIKELDAIFLLRKTTSPIIYLQQLGRLLSFSKNHHQLYVFDLVNNAMNNSVIYELYSELVAKARIKMVEDPENKERYQKILDYFKIINITGEIANRIDTLEKELTKEKMIELRLEYAVNLLCNSEENKYDYENLQAHLDIFKYKKYITREQFKLLSSLPIEKPSIFNLTYEEFDRYLNKYNSINELLRSKTKTKVQEIYEFYEYTYHLPYLFSEDVEERDLANAMLVEYEKYSDRTKSFISQHIEEDSSLIEKFVYLNQFDPKQKDKLYEEIYILINENRPISFEILEFLDNQKDETSSDLLEKIRINKSILSIPLVDNIPIIDEEYDQKVIKEKYNINPDILLKELSFAELKNWMNNNSSDRKEYLEKLFNDLVIFIETEGKTPSYNSKNEYEQQLFIQYYIFYKELNKEGYIDKITKVKEEFEIKKIEQHKKNFLSKLVPFLEENDGCLPYEGSYNSDEQQLAKDYNQLYEFFSTEEKDIIKQHQGRLELHKNITIKSYINFINKKGRRPLISNKSEDEYKIALDFLRIEPYLTEEEQLLIETATSRLNKYEEQRRLLREMLNEKGKRQ